MRLAFCVTALLALPAAPITQAQTLTMSTAAAAAADAPALTSAVIRINGKRFKKISDGQRILLVPSQGLALSAAIPEALCGTKSDDEVLEITKAVPADAELQGLTKEVLAQMDTCKGATTGGATEKNGIEDCVTATNEPTSDPNGGPQQGSGKVTFGCKTGTAKP